MRRTHSPRDSYEGLTPIARGARIRGEHMGLAALVVLSCSPLLHSVVDVFSFDDAMSGGYSGPARIELSVLAVALAADLDEDGADELVAIGDSGTQIMMIEGNGTSTEMWRGPEVAAVTWTTATVSGGGDGYLLVLTTDFQRDESILLQASCEGGTCRESREVATLPTSTALATGDMNDDGVVDLLVRGEQDIFILLGAGAAATGLELGAPHSEGSIPSYVLLDNELHGVDRIHTADLDADGKTDVVAVERDRIAVFFGEGDGRLSEVQLIELPEATEQPPTIESVHVASLDGSPHVDIVVGLSEESLVFKNTDGRSFQTMPPIRSRGSATKTFPGHFRGSTAEVAVVAYFDGIAELVAMDGDTWTTRQVEISTDYDYSIHNGVVADLDGNGRDEVVLVSPRQKESGCQ